MRHETGPAFHRLPPSRPKYQGPESTCALFGLPVAGKAATEPRLTERLPISAEARANCSSIFETAYAREDLQSPVSTVKCWGLPHHGAFASGDKER